MVEKKKVKILRKWKNYRGNVEFGLGSDQNIYVRHVEDNGKMVLVDISRNGNSYQCIECGYRIKDRRQS